MELTAPRRWVLLNAGSEKSALTVSWKAKGGKENRLQPMPMKPWRETEREAHLAVIEGTVDREAVDVVVEDGGHLSLLDGRDSTGGEEHEDGDVGFPSDSVDGSTTEQGNADQFWPFNFSDESSRESLAYLPVSPLVAPTIVNASLASSSFFPSFLLFKKYSNRLPKNCNATSLNANVGPCHNSSTYSPSSPSFFNGVVSGWRKVE
jgi:hypothetical protein